MDALECAHLLKLAEIIVECSLFRQESRGAHYRDDFPDRDDTNFLLHSLAHQQENGIRISTRPVRITKFQPVERKY
jgi:succinate dehydrogenase / fumarate reductase flavoprotein subunit